LHSTLETVNVASTDRRAVYTAPGRIGAPNWTKDGTTLIFNRDGKIERLAIANGTVELVETSSLKACGNAHGLSPDGTQLALTCGSRVYVMPVTGGPVNQIAKDASWRGWSPDGRKVLISNEVGLHSAEIAGGKPTLIARNARSGEFSPDGSFVYFDSDRSGTSQIWRVRADGSGEEPVTSDEFQNSRPHLSPDGTRIVFLSAKKLGLPEDSEVTLRMLTIADKSIKVLATLVGGPATLEAPSWSPDGRQLSYVSHQFVE
jgi:Tol biopolymer transport system component